MDEMRVWDGVKESSKNKLLRSTWAGYVGKKRDEKLAKRVGVQKMEGKWRREKPKLRWDIAL